MLLQKRFIAVLWIRIPQIPLFRSHSFLCKGELNNIYTTELFGGVKELMHKKTLPRETHCMKTYRKAWRFSPTESTHSTPSSCPVVSSLHCRGALVLCTNHCESIIIDRCSYCVQLSLVFTQRPFFCFRSQYSVQNTMWYSLHVSQLWRFLHPSLFLKALTVLSSSSQPFWGMCLS